MALSNDSGPLRNRLLARLPSGDFQRILPLLEPVNLELKQVLYSFRQAIDYVYFPGSGMVSAMTVMEDGRAIEVATIGNEGMVGLTAFVGGAISPHEVMVQIAGDAQRMSADALRQELKRDGTLRKILIHYDTAFAVQLAYSVACNGLHTVEKRCCRWLLTAHDRVESNMIPLTHEFLAIMLGVRRASVTEVLTPLQDAGLIRNGRGEIEILDRPGLEARACECYEAVSQEFARIFE